MKMILRFMMRLVVIISGFLFTFSLPYLFGIANDEIRVSFQAFWKSITTNFIALVHLRNNNHSVSLKVLHIADSYQYTMTILIASLLVVFLLATLTAVCVMIAPRKIQNWLKNGINFMEGVPDLLVIFLFQFFAIALVKKTGLMIFQLYGIFGAKPYFIPVVTVSFLPFFLLLQFLIKVMTEEQNQLYVLYLRAKGIGMVRIFLVHIFRNIFPLLFLQMRTIVWVTMANIYLIEYMFNLNGFTKMLLMLIGNLPLLLVCLLMLAIPLVAVETGGWFLTKRLIRKEDPGL